MELTPSQKFASVAALLAALVVACLWFGRDASAPTGHDPIVTRPEPSAQSSSITRTSQADPASGLAQPGAPALVAANRGPSAQLRRDFVAAKDMRKFALDAMNRPSEGGYYYARFAALRCTKRWFADSKFAQEKIRATVAETGTVSSARMAEPERAGAVCLSFTQDESLALSREISAREKDGLDPLINAQMALAEALKSSDKDAVRRAGDALLKTGDVLAFADFAQRVASSDPEAKQAHGSYFQGVVYPPDAGFAVAARLASCTDNGPCSIDDDLAALCVLHGNCLPDRRAYAKYEFTVVFSGNESQFSKVLELEGRVRLAIANRDISAFVR